MNRVLLKAELVRHEGFRRLPYQDAAGILTVGVGRNLERPLSDAAIRFLLDEDIAGAIADCERLIISYAGLDDTRQRVLVNMMFNLGPIRLLGFKKFLSAVGQRDFTLAAEEMLNSAWAHQVGARAVELAAMMRDGV